MLSQFKTHASMSGFNLCELLRNRPQFRTVGCNGAATGAARDCSAAGKFSVHVARRLWALSSALDADARPKQRRKREDVVAHQLRKINF
jgi:hypothetical protein